MNVQKHDLRNNHILLKILISLRKSYICSGLTDSKSCRILWALKTLSRIGAKSAHSRRMCCTEGCVKHGIHWGASSPFSKYAWVNHVCPMRKRARTISSQRKDRKAGSHSPSTGLIEWSLLFPCSVQSLCKSS